MLSSAMSWKAARKSAAPCKISMHYVNGQLQQLTGPAMILEIQHETRFEYSEPVSESLTEVRMEPAIDVDQSCCSFHLSVTPATELFRYQDGFCNRVHHYNIRPAHREVRILAASIVETHPRPKSLEAAKATWPLDL